MEPQEPKNKILFKTEWLSLRSVEGPTGPYVYSHEDRCNGSIVVILPYKKDNNDLYVLVREEYTPCWGVNRKNLATVTGGVDKGELPMAAAIRELQEEVGFTVQEEEMESLGTSRGSKSSDTVYHLFAVDVTGKAQGTVRPGDINEANAKNIWISGSFSGVADPLFYACLYRWENTPRDPGSLSSFSWS